MGDYNEKVAVFVEVFWPNYEDIKSVYGNDEGSQALLEILESSKWKEYYEEQVKDSRNFTNKLKDGNATGNEKWKLLRLLNNSPFNIS